MYHQKFFNPVTWLELNTYINDLYRTKNYEHDFIQLLFKTKKIYLNTYLFLLIIKRIIWHASKKITPKNVKIFYIKLVCFIGSQYKCLKTDVMQTNIIMCLITLFDFFNPEIKSKLTLVFPNNSSFKRTPLTSFFFIISKWFG